MIVHKVTGTQPIETRPPCKDRQAPVRGYRDRTTHMAIVLAANRLGVAAVAAADADDGDRGAGHSEQDIHILDNNPE